MDLVAFSQETGLEFFGGAVNSQGRNRGFAIGAVEGLDPVELLDEDATGLMDGLYEGPSRYAHRDIRFEGQVVADSDEDMQALRIEFGGLPKQDTLLVKQGNHHVTYEGGWRGAPRFRTVPIMHGAFGYWQHTFRALYPFGLGEPHEETVAAGDALFLPTFGNMPAWPVFDCVGPLPSGWRIQLGERWTIINEAVPSGRTWRFDWRRFRLTDHTGARRSGNNRGRPGPIPLGGASLSLVAASGSVRVRYFDTYN